MPDLLNPKFKIDFISLSLLTNTIKEIAIDHNVLYLVSNDLSTDLKISFDNGAKYTSWKENFKISGLQSNSDGEIKTIFLKNDSTSTMSIEFYAINGDIDDRTLNTLTTINATFAGDEINTPAQISVTTAQTSIPANSDRKELIIQNNGSFDLWFGDSDTAINRGIKVGSAKTFVLNSQAKTYLISDGGTNLVNYLENNEA